MTNYTKAAHLDTVSYEIRGEIAQRSKDLKEQGYNIIELNIGNPAIFRFRTPETMSRAIIMNMDKSEGYSDSQGIFPAREAIVMETQNIGIKGVDIDHVFIGNGVSELIMICAEALLNPGDEILLPCPDYPLWTAAVKICGGRAVYYNCDETNSWYPDVEHIKANITNRTRAIVLINPNNPTGAVYPKEILEEIIDIARKNKLVIFSDEIYHRILYNGAKRYHIATMCDDVLIVTLNGLSKNYRACGYRVGWAIISGPVKNALDYLDGLRLLSSMRLCSNVMGQWAVQTALGGYQSVNELTEKGGRLFNQMNFAYEALNQIEHIKCVKPQGAIYLFPEYDPEYFDFKNDKEFALQFLEEYHVLVVPGSGFNFNNRTCFRMTFLPFQDTLQIAMDRLAQFLNKHLIKKKG